MNNTEWKSPNECPEADAQFFAVWRITHPRIGGKSWLTGDSEFLPPPERAFGISLQKQWDGYRNDTPDGVLLAWRYESEFEAALYEAFQCDDCNGEGFIERGLRGTKHECPTCNGSGTTTPAPQGTWTGGQIDIARLLVSEDLVTNVQDKGTHIEMDLKL